MRKSWFIVLAAIPLILVGSIAVWQLSGNDARRAGALGPIEKPIPLAWRGTWTSDAKYDIGQVVSHKGSSYVAEEANGAQVPNAKDGPWALMAAMGPQGAQGPPGAGIANLDQLRGLACNAGQPEEGTVSVTYDTSTTNATIQCKPTNLVRLTVTAFATLPPGSWQVRTMTITASDGTRQIGSCYDSGATTGGVTCRWWVPRSATVTLTGTTGTWNVDCSGTSSTCSLVMSYDRTVSRQAS